MKTQDHKIKYTFTYNNIQQYMKHPIYFVLMTSTTEIHWTLFYHKNWLQPKQNFTKCCMPDKHLVSKLQYTYIQ